MTSTPLSPPPAAVQDVLVVGYGNSIRGDDALGQVVAEQIEQQLLPDDHVRVLTLEILTTDLAADLAQVRLAIFLDAAAYGEVGQVECRRLQPDPVSAASMAHKLSIPALLAFSREFFGRAPLTYLISSPGATFELQDVRLSPALQAVVPEMVARALDLIRHADEDADCVLPGHSATR